MKRRILHVVPSLRYGSAARQASLVSAGLNGDFDCQVVSLTVGGPTGTTLARAGVPVTVLGSRGRIDPRPAWELRRILRDFSPDVIHAWEPMALRAILLAAWTARTRAKLLVSRPLSRSSNHLGDRLDAWLLGGADAVAVTGGDETQRCLAAGVPAARIRPVRPGVRLPAQVPPRARDARYIACVGPIESHKGLKDAVWAFDVIRYIYNDLYLLLLGTGPHEKPLRAFARDIGADPYVYYLGDLGEVSDVFARAEVVWVPGRSGGVGAIMEAMAVGRPIVASRLRQSVELLGDGTCGVLVPPNDPAELARQTRRLLDNPELSQRMGEVCRQRAASDFDADNMVRDYQTLYEELTASRSQIRKVAG